MTKIDIDDLTLRQIKELTSFNPNNNYNNNLTDSLEDYFKGHYVIIRTYSAGVWAGFLEKKVKDEVIIREARRLWRWHCNKSISLSGVALYGLNYDKSKICAPLKNPIWLQAIEILPVNNEIKENIINAPEVQQ